jgi:hypothetical protein
MQRHQASQDAGTRPDDAAVARAILAVMAEPPKPSVPKPLSRLQREVAEDFLDVRRQWARR